LIVEESSVKNPENLMKAERRTGMPLAADIHKPAKIAEILMYANRSIDAVTWEKL